MRLLSFYFTRFSLCLAVSVTMIATTAKAQKAAPESHDQPQAELLGVRKIWDAAPHNAFTDLIRFQDRWICAFREAENHMGTSADGHIRVIESNDTETWTPVTLLADPRGDIRDAKLSILPDGRLELLTAVHLHTAAGAHPAYQSIAFFTQDLKKWDGPVNVGEPDVWLWGLKWHGGIGLSIGYGTQASARFVRLYKTSDGLKFEPIVAKLDVTATLATESAITFENDGLATVLLRCDPEPAYIGQAKPPYTDWQLKQSKTRIGGPALTHTPDGRLLGAGRLHEGVVHTSLFWVDPAKSEINELLRLPSGGDTSYPGLVWFNGVLNVSYYSTHEGKTSIYLAKVRVPQPQK